MAPLWGEPVCSEGERAMICIHKGILRQVATMVLGGVLLLGGATLQAAEKPQSRLLELKPMARQNVERLNKEARKNYELGMVAVDKINYEKGLDYFEKAVQQEPDNVSLRYMVIQMAQYLADTRFGTESIKYYDKVEDNLKAMIASPRLNAREKERAQGALETITALRQTVAERDEKRQKTGLEMGKAYAKQVYKEPAKERAAKLKAAQVQAAVQETLTGAPMTLNRGRVSNTTTGNYSMNSSSRMGK